MLSLCIVFFLGFTDCGHGTFVSFLYLSRVCETDREYFISLFIGQQKVSKRKANIQESPIRPVSLYFSNTMANGRLIVYGQNVSTIIYTFAPRTIVL